MICTDLQAANQLQITWFAGVDFQRFSGLWFALICSLQITANQSLPTFKKHCKTRANQRKSLQITSLKNHRKNYADLQTPAVLDLAWEVGRKAQDFVRAVKSFLSKCLFDYGCVCNAASLDVPRTNQSASIEANWQTSTPTRQCKPANHWAPSASQQTGSQEDASEPA